MHAHLPRWPPASLLHSCEKLSSYITKSHDGQIQGSKKERGIKAGSLLLAKASVGVCTDPADQPEEALLKTDLLEK